MALQNKENNQKLTAKELAALYQEKAASDPNCRLKNPFTQGVNFDDGEAVSFVSFGYNEWEDDGVGVGHKKGYGIYPVIRLSTPSGEKSLAIGSLTKAKGGILIDDARNAERKVGMWANEGGLASVAKGCSQLNEESLQKIADWFKKTKTAKIAVRWVEVNPTFFVSLVNVVEG